MGEGPPDIMYVPGIYAQLELMLQIPAFGRNYQEIARFSRLIRMDKRGQGLSDPIVGKVGLKERTEDVRAVMDAASSERAVVIGYSESGTIAINYAYKYPERVKGLILWGAFARNVQGPDWEIGATVSAMRKMGEGWGSGVMRSILMPGLEKEGVTLETFKAMERMSATREGINAAIDFMIEADTRHLLPLIKVPTLIIHYTGDVAVPIEGARYMAEKIPGARMVEIAGVDHASFDGDGLIVGAIRDFCASLSDDDEATANDKTVETDFST
jgi:pimeloyl-ACP methyl ester carboxylesterase